MCRLAAWLGAEIALEEIIVRPPHSLIQQSLAANEAKLSVHGDGFGFAWYDADAQLGIYKTVAPAWADGNLSSLGAMIRSGLFLAHVRSSTYGQTSHNNCHPFTSNSWSFMHNGQIANFASHRRELEAALSDDRFHERKGNTDSELLFLLLLDHGLEHNVIDACGAVLALIDSMFVKRGSGIRIAAVFSDGHCLYALRYSTDGKSPSLYYCLNTEGSLLIASEPLNNNQDQWNQVGEATLLKAKVTTSNCRDIQIVTMAVSPEKACRQKINNVLQKTS